MGRTRDVDEQNRAGFAEGVNVRRGMEHTKLATICWLPSSLLIRNFMGRGRKSSLD